MSTMGQQRQSKKKTKVTRNSSDVPIGGHNLRSRSRRNNAENEEGHGGEDDLEDLQNFSPLVDNKDLNHGAQQKKKGRGVTRMQDIYSRGPDMPKLTIVLNEFGQPVGTNSEKLSSVVGTMVRKIIPVGCDDWRRVDPEKKYEVWTALQSFYNLDEAAFKWVITTAGRKWKEFKSFLKERYFDNKLTDEELMAKKDDRVTDPDWKYLIDYWRSPESEALTAIAKANCAKLVMLHTSGSMSHARVGYELGKKLGRPPRRDEVFIETHQHKSGVPVRISFKKLQ